MASSTSTSIPGFHQDASLHTTTQAVSKWQSIRHLTAALWKNRAAFNSAGLVAASKDVIPAIPLNDPMNGLLTRGVVHYLWGSMLHPPMSYRGSKFQYRTADGSNHNPLIPDLGKASLPYAKSVQGKRAMLGAKPDPGDLFDLIMAREESNNEGRESDTGISSFLLYQATIVIHDIFRTNEDDRNISDTSSYLDLAPLYGSNQEAQNSIRTMKDGLLKPDTFADHRLLNQPPGVSIFLIMYNRFHNYVAKQLLDVNENGRFALPPNFSDLDSETQKKVLKKRDDDLFQTARLITCGLYAQIAIHDYLRCLMMMHAKDTSWTLDPRAEYNGLLDRGTLKRGEGNMVSVEFNLLYRFHSAISVRDAGWSTELLRLWMFDKIDDKATDDEIAMGEKMTNAMFEKGDIPVPIMMGKIREANKRADSDVKERMSQPYFPLGLDRVGGDFSDPIKHPERTFKFRRDPTTGYFDDAQLVAELVRSIEDPMCSFGARQIPKAFKSIEILGILQSRKWEVATLNEFRQFFGMKKHERFEDITDDPIIVDRLRDLYEDPDMVEMYPGYLCEGRTRNLDPNVTCPGSGGTTTLWRGVFSDAVTLVRSDRFYTTDWNVDSITAWGMSEVASDPTINKGGLLHRLFQRAFPGYFTYNSLHLWEPYYTPARNLLLAEEQGYLNNLDLTGLEYQFEAGSQSNQTWHALEPKLIAKGSSAGQVQKGFIKKLVASQKGNFRVRRQLRPHPERNSGWAGVELASKIAVQPVKIKDYITIKDEFLGGKHTLWANPAIAHPLDIPDGPLRQIMTNKYQRWDEAMEVLRSSLGQHEHELRRHFIEYFTALAGYIRHREQRPFQKCNDMQIYQLDIVKDFVIPILVRFMVDFMGFWELVKTPEFPEREFFENDIFRLIEDCQNYQAWDSDVTKGMKRRQLFQTSIRKLQRLAYGGAYGSAAGFLGWRNFGRNYGTKGDSEAVKDIRRLGVKTVQALNAKGFSTDEVAALMLNFTLESVYKINLAFTEMVAFFIDPKSLDFDHDELLSHGTRTKLWKDLQKVAFEDKDYEISKYVLEAQRLSTAGYLAREYLGLKHTGPSARSSVSAELNSLPKNTLVLADIQAANHDPKIFPRPNAFILDTQSRNPSNYLFYGSVFGAGGEVIQGVTLSRQLSLAALTSLLKATVRLRNLRVAHDKGGRLKRVYTPGAGLPGYGESSSLLRYATPRWDALLPIPSTWGLRYDGGEGEGVYTGKDNADHKHGANQVYQEDGCVVHPAV
jgi:hypothetical protein